MAGKSRKLLRVFAVVAVLAVLGVFLFIATQPAPPLALPNPNGYDDFLKAGVAVNGDPSTSSTLDHDRLSQLISTNAESLSLLRLGLTRQSVVPTDSVLTNFLINSTDLVQLKRLCLLLAAEGRLAELEGRPADAANSYVDAIRLGNEMSKGGFLINRLVGVACEAIGYGPLIKLVPQLSCEQAQPIIAALEKIDEEGVKWDDILRAERRFARRQFRVMHNPIAWVAGWLEERPAIAKAREKHYVILARLRLVATELALRCYRSSHGQPPDRVEQLIPEYLQHTPLDPFSGQLLAYRPQGTNWLLYSFGVDRKDDGGKPIGHSVSGTLNQGDLFYDSPW